MNWDKKTMPLTLVMYFYCQRLTPKIAISSILMLEYNHNLLSRQSWYSTFSCIWVSLITLLQRAVDWRSGASIFCILGPVYKTRISRKADNREFTVL